MAQAKSVLAFEEIIYGFLDPARDSPNGISIKLETPEAAFSLVMRLRTALSRLAAQSREIFPSDDPAHGKHGYEGLVIQYAKGQDIIFIRKLDITNILDMVGATIKNL